MDHSSLLSTQKGLTTPTTTTGLNVSSQNIPEPQPSGEMQGSPGVWRKTTPTSLETAGYTGGWVVLLTEAGSLSIFTSNLIKSPSLPMLASTSPLSQEISPFPELRASGSGVQGTEWDSLEHL